MLFSFVLCALNDRDAMTRNLRQWASSGGYEVLVNLLVCKPSMLDLFEDKCTKLSTVWRNDVRFTSGLHLQGWMSFARALSTMRSTVISLYKNCITYGFIGCFGILMACFDSLSPPDSSHKASLMIFSQRLKKPTRGNKWSKSLPQ